MKKKILSIILSCIVLAAPLTVGAIGSLNDALPNLERSGQEAYGENPEASLDVIVGGYIRVALSLVGILFLALMVYAGYLWMTARGEDAQIDKAKKIISSSVIGLLVVASAYAITFFVTSQFK
ncbi:MAG: hypothetical protein HN726_04245 [Candidatus Magasanikbacteria bacterium]|jgi:hypothetical protein|nr:hypothetical protein [Candidatus Magasanikbacteria bacterium]MBT6252815.1 hypothetical protein [Candidatus Magasanikbacteria bacterium]MBT6334382.1 hypothetical protein [Candidatus Magasanikbacteria bacterium]MBT7755379.1 hypothetical protein [Candidatus Magasanikbacteria bacterium]